MIFGVPMRKSGKVDEINKNKEIIFIVEESLNGAYEARSVGYSIFTEAETVPGLKENIVETVFCHFNEEDMP